MLDKGATKRRLRLMPYPKAAFTQRDVTRIAKGMRAANIEEWWSWVELPSGTRMIFGAGKASEAPGPSDPDLDAMIRRVPTKKKRPQ